MAEDKHKCEGCKKRHLAATWYSGGTSYLCGKGYYKLSPGQKMEWKQIHPGSDEQGHGSKSTAALPPRDSETLQPFEHTP